MAASIPTGAVSGADGGKEQRTYPLLSRREVETMIAEGRTLIIVNQHVLKVDGWLKYHPGGDKAIAHTVGRDATDEVTVLHSPEAQQMMNKYRIGRIEGRWTNFIPPIQGGKFRPAAEGGDDDYVQDLEDTPGPISNPSSNPSSRSASPVFDVLEYNNSGLRARPGHGSTKTRTESVTSMSSVSSEEQYQATDGMAFLESETRKEISLDLERYPPLDPEVQDEIVVKYRALYERIKAEGLFDCNYTAYGIECIRYSLLFASFLLFLRWGWYIASAICLGGFWHQLVFTAHDAGHMGITHDFQTDSVIGIIIADFLGGLSIGWWKRNHNVHHIVTNFPEHDPDIEHLPFFAVSHRLLGNLRSTYYEKVMEYDAFAKVFIAVQHYTYYIIMLFARFNLYRLSWDHLLFSRGPKHGIAAWHRNLEIAGQVFFWTWFGYGVMYRSIPTAGSRILFLLISHAVTAPLHVQITLPTSPCPLPILDRTNRSRRRCSARPWMSTVPNGWISSMADCSSKQFITCIPGSPGIT